MRNPWVLSYALVVLVACGLANRESQGETMTFSDGDFAEWSFGELSSSNSSATASVAETSGNPLPSITVTTRTGSIAWGWAINEAAVWNPSIHGPISTISLDIDVKSITGWGQGQALRLVVEQEGRLYFGPDPGVSHNTGSSSTWHTVSGGPLLAEDFVHMTGPWSWDPGENPDFSSGGAPLQFGFAAGNANSGTYTQLYDNWSMSLDVIPEPSTTMMMLGGGVVALSACGLWPRGRRGRQR